MVSLWVYILADIFFAIVAIYFSFRYEKKSGQVDRQAREITRKVFELSLLQEITDKIGYSLNIGTVAETLCLTVEKLFDLTTVSYAIRQDDTIHLKTFAKEAVAAPYLAQLSKLIVAGMISIEPQLSGFKLEESTIATSAGHRLVRASGPEGKQFEDVISQEALQAVPQSYFNIPLILDNRLVGMINVSSKRKIKYNDEDTALLFKIVNASQGVIQKLHTVIKNEESKLDSLILTLPFGTIMFVVEGEEFKLSVINRAAQDFLRTQTGATMGEVLGRFGRDLKIGEIIQTVFTSRLGQSIPDAKIYDRHFAIFVNPVFVPDRQALIGVALIMHDITSEKKLESIRADFTDMMMHELRAPLTAIRGAASLLVAKNLPPQDQEKMPRIILDSSNDMLSTVSDFLDAAKIDEGKFKLAKTKADIVEVIGDHVEIFSYVARGKNITINFDSKAQMPEFLFDAVRIGQVINNLISNSIKFTNEGGTIDIKIDVKSAEIEVTVTDNGIGIAENKKAVLFTKFGQIDGNIDRVHTPAGRSSGSSGLGLFISRQIVDAHGGKIWLESTENVGTVVHFTLPLVTEDAAEALPASHPANVSN